LLHLKTKSQGFDEQGKLEYFVEGTSFIRELSRGENPRTFNF
jgi:hypothetical protein